jgi:signal transduction histidine kinase
MDDLDRARAGTETASMVKTNFLRVMSHELKTPITAVQLHVRALEHDSEIHPSPKLKDGLARIGRSSRRLATLVETALQWARIESGDARLTVTEVSLRPIVEDIVAELKTYADHKSITLRIDGEPETLHSDARLLRLLLHNVIERAIQVTDEGGVRIALSVGAAGHVVSVDDASAPIAPGQEQELFDTLPVADLHRRGGTGSGLGLHVVRDVARALGGLVALAPKAGGNTLTITLPPALVPRRAGG